MRCHSVHLPPQLYDAVLDAVRRGLAGNVSEYVRQAVIDMLTSGEHCPPPPLPIGQVKMPIVTFNLTTWARKRLEELLHSGVYKTLSDAVRAAVWRAVHGGCREGDPPPPLKRGGEEVEEDVHLIVGRPAARGAPPPPPQRPQLPPPREGALILLADEARWTDETWSRVAPCVKTLLVRAPECRQWNGAMKCLDAWETYYLVDIECTRRRGVEV